ncbi:MAG: hypothetical protein DDT25_00601 [Chloroflexi bacterium]|nr:hypothetical protein [Chloroflexota bacterium]
MNMNEAAETEEIGPEKGVLDRLKVVLEWMKENAITKIETKVVGGGDEGHLEYITHYKDGEEYDLEESEDKSFEANNFKWILEEAAFDLAYWDAVNNDGGQVDLELNVDGTYRVTGGWYGGYTEADPLDGRIEI